MIPANPELTIIESEMAFGPFEEGHCFHIEKSAAYLSIQEGVQIAEFCLLRKTGENPPVATVWIVEAKSSTPRPETEPGFDEFISEIRVKLLNTFSLCLALCLHRHLDAPNELPMLFRQLNLSTVDFRFVLVINGHREAWLVPLEEALSKALHATLRTWNVRPPAVVVLNDALAREYGLIAAAI